MTEELLKEISEAFDETITSEAWLDGGIPMSNLVGRDFFFDRVKEILEKVEDANQATCFWEDSNLPTCGKCWDCREHYM